MTSVSRNERARVEAEGYPRIASMSFSEVKCSIDSISVSDQPHLAHSIPGKSPSMLCAAPPHVMVGEARNGRKATIPAQSLQLGIAAAGAAEWVVIGSEG